MSITEGAAPSATMLIQNRGARLYWLEGTKFVPGDVRQVSVERGRKMIEAGRHARRGGVVHEIVEVVGEPLPLPGVKAPGLADLSEEKAIDLVGKCNVDSLEKLTEGETRPEVLAAAAKRRKGNTR